MVSIDMSWPGEEGGEGAGGSWSAEGSTEGSSAVAVPLSADCSFDSTDAEGFGSTSNAAASTIALMTSAFHSQSSSGISSPEILKSVNVLFASSLPPLVAASLPHLRSLRGSFPSRPPNAPFAALGPFGAS